MSIMFDPILGRLRKKDVCTTTEAEETAYLLLQDSGEMLLENSANIILSRGVGYLTTEE